MSDRATSPDVPDSDASGREEALDQATPGFHIAEHFTVQAPGQMLGASQVGLQVFGRRSGIAGRRG
jgi:RecG-like helicase